MRAGETEWNELNIVDVLPRGDKVDMRGRTYISIYSSRNDRYPINGQEGHATLRGEFMDFQAGGRAGSKATVMHQGNSFEAEVDVAVWTSSLFANEWFTTNDTPFIATVSRSSGGYEVTIENLLDRPLTEIRMAVGQFIFQLDAVQPGATETFSLSADAGKPLQGFVQENGQFFKRAAERRREPLGDTAGAHIDDRPLTVAVASFISYLDPPAMGGRSFVYPPGLDLTPQILRGDAVILAWLPDFSFTGKINDFQPPRFKQDTVLRLTVPVRGKSSI